MTGRERRLRRHLIQRWFEPAEHEPATAYFSRLAGRNNQTSARTFADDMGFDGRTLDPADCLDAVSHLEIAGMDGLIHATPVVTSRTVRLLGVEVRRRHWTEAPRVCPGCLAESAHHRGYHSLRSFTVCPFHGCGIVGGSNGPLAWWHPHLDRAPDGALIARAMPRLDPSPSFELWLLGRLGVAEPICVPLLDDASVPVAIDTVDVLGRAALCGWRAAAPRIGRAGLTRDAVVAAGFQVLLGGMEAVEALFDDIARQGEANAEAEQWGLQYAYGWLYRAIFFRETTRTLSDVVFAGAARTAERRRLFARLTAAVNGCDEPSGRLHRHEIASALGIQARLVDPIAGRLGVRPVAKAGRSVVYDASALNAIREGLARSVGRAEAAGILGLEEKELQDIERLGLIRRLCRLGGPTAASNLYVPAELACTLSMGLLPAVSSEDRRYVDLTTLAGMTGLSRPEILSICAAGRLIPVGSVIGMVGLSGLAFKEAEAGQLRTTSPTASKPGGRLRRRRAWPGLARSDVASALGVNIDTVSALVRKGYLQTVGDEVGGTSRNQIDEASLRAFSSRYAPAVAYAPALKCGRTDAVRRFRELGVATHVKEQHQSRVMAFVLRADVAVALALPEDPLSASLDGWTSFWTNFREHLAAKGSIMRLTRILSKGVGCVRTADGRSTISISIGDGGQVTVTLKARRASEAKAEPLRAVQGDFRLDERHSWHAWFDWLEMAAYRMRTRGGLSGATDERISSADQVAPSQARSDGAAMLSSDAQAA